MNITQAAFRFNRVTIILVTILVTSGIFAYINLPKAQDPGFIIRTAVITTRLPGANPQRIELLVTDKIEKKIQEMPEIDFITSESQTGISIINVNFLAQYKNMRPIFDDLRRKVENIRPDLPEGITSLSVNDEFGDVFGSVYTLTGEGFSYAELKNIADDIRDQLLKIPEIAKINIHGAQKEVIFVEYNNAQLTRLGISPKQLSGVLGNVNILSSGGNIIAGRERIVLEPTGNFESLQDLSNTVIQLPDGGVVYLQDIADIERAYIDPQESIVRANGKPALAIAISMHEGSDILKLGEKLDRIIPEIKLRYPWGISLEKVWFQAELVKQNVNNFVKNLFQAIGIVILVMIITLGLRTGIVVATLIPTTMLISLYVMQIFGITINTISLAALIISLGLLVDNAIVIVDSVLVKYGSGLTAKEAAIKSGNEFLLPLLISSLTTAAAFMPIALAESAVGEYTADIFYVVTISLISSWLLAMTFVPMLASKILCRETVRQTPTQKSQNWYVFYGRILTITLRHRILFCFMTLLLFLIAIYSLNFVPKIFIEPSEDPVFSGGFEMPLGTAIENSQAIMSDIDQFVQKNYFAPQNATIKNWLTFIGEGGPRFTLGLNPPNPNPANSFLIGTTVDGKDVEKVINGIQEYANQNYPDLKLRLSRLENGPPVGYPVQIRISGPEIKQLSNIAEQITAKLYQNPMITTVKNSWGKQTKKLLVKVDQARARRAGVTSDDVAYSLKTSLSGIQMTEYREGDKLIPVLLRSVAAERQDIGKIDNISIYSQSTAKSVPLKQVADIQLVFEPGKIERRNRNRTITLKAQIKENAAADKINLALLEWLESKQWQDGYEYAAGGTTEESGKANAAIGEKLPIAIMAIILLLVMQFNSVRFPIIILATIPFGLIGVSFGLLSAQSSFGFFTILGIIALSGIVINNAIVLLDRIRVEIKTQTPQTAIISSCQQRLRPVLLTTATTVFGMLPLWWGGTAMFRPMAITIIFGLAFASILTLLLVPVLYSILFGISFRHYQADKTIEQTK